MNLQMYPLDNPLTTRPIQTGREIIIEQYLKLQFQCIAKQEHKLGKGSVSTQTKT
jgi:hypothetical protein